MIVNVKSLMAVLMATILMLAVVIPITGAMASMSTEKGYADNEVKESDYRMAKAGASADLLVSNVGGVVTLYVGEADGVVLTPDKDIILSDTFLLEVATELGDPTFWVSVFGETEPVVGMAQGAYMTIADGNWAIYDSGAPRSVSETKEIKEAKVSKEPAKAATPIATGHYASVYYKASDGNWIYGDAPLNVDSDTRFYVVYDSLVASGTLNSLLPVNNLNPVSLQCQYTASGATNSLTGITLSETASDETITTGLLVPLQYTDGEKMGMTGTLVSLIPVVLIVGVIIAAVSMMILRRQEDSL